MLIQIANGSKQDRTNLKVIYGIIFFAFLSQGMNKESLIAMAGNQSNKYHLESLCKELDLLQEQRLRFPEAFSFQRFRDYMLLRNYEITECTLRGSAFPVTEAVREQILRM